MKRNKKIFSILVIILVVLFILPLIFIKVSKPHELMGILILLFFIINPLATIVVNIIVGKDIKKLWFMPILFSLVFLLSYWLIFWDIILDLMFYAINYLVIGFVFMIISFFINKILKVKK